MTIGKIGVGVWRIRRQTLFALASLMLIVGHVVAQSTCPTLVEEALEALDDECADLARNQACYGNVSLEVTPQPNADDFHFEKVGDIAQVVDIQTLKLQPMDVDAGTWGVVMMQLQADIPDTLPGQNVTFVLFGNVEIENTATDEQTPMQAFTIQTGISDAGCDEAPESGVMIQTPDGVESVAFNVNGVDMEIGSTVMLQAEPEGDLMVATMEGAAVMEMDGQSYSVIAGTEMSIPMGADMRPIGIPSMPVGIEAARMGTGAMMPSLMLPRPIDFVEPISDESMAVLEERMEEGLPPCGVEGLPDCEHALRIDDARIWADKDAFRAIDEILPDGLPDLPGLPDGSILPDNPLIPGGRDSDDASDDQPDGPIATRFPGRTDESDDSDRDDPIGEKTPDSDRPMPTPDGSGSRGDSTIGKATPVPERTKPPTPVSDKPRDDSTIGRSTPLPEPTKPPEVKPDESGSQDGSRDGGSEDPAPPAGGGSEEGGSEPPPEQP